jgi:hypothetical protein
MAETESSDGASSDGAGHLATIEAFLDKFQAALQERWQDSVYTAICDDEVMPLPWYVYGERYQAPWDHRSAAVAAHIHFGCEYMKWYDGGRNGSLPSTCHGRTHFEDQAPEGTWWYRGATVEIPASFDCGVGALFAATENWAWNERQHVFKSLPLFADQSLSNLRRTYDAYAAIAEGLGAPAPSDTGSEVSLDPGANPLVEAVDGLNPQGRDDDEAWLADYTGLAADALRKGYLASTGPTLWNHAALAVGLATLVNVRSQIILTFRKSTLDLIKNATAKLGATVTVTETTGFSEVWKGVTETGLLGGVVGDALALNPALKLASGIIKLGASSLRFFGWNGLNFFSEKTIEIETYAYSPEGVVRSLCSEISGMKSELESAESEYSAAAAALRNDLNAVPSALVELYDITRNNPEGRA